MSTLFELLKVLRRNRGQVALETLIVFVPWFLMTMMFFNLVFLLGSQMLRQAQIDRLALETAALGCLYRPAADNAGGFTADPTASGPGLGASKMTIYAATPELRLGDQGTGDRSDGSVFTSFNRSSYVNADGTPKSSTTRDATCQLDTTPGRAGLPKPGWTPVESGRFIYIAGIYDQDLLALDLIIPGGKPRIVRSALVVSHYQQGEQG